MSRISIKPGDSFIIGEDITIQFDKFFDGCSHVDIDAYDEVSVVRGPGVEPAEEEIQACLWKLSKEMMDGLSKLRVDVRKEFLGALVGELYYSAAAQDRSEKNRRRQTEAIAAAKERGIRFGWEQIELPWISQVQEEKTDRDSFTACNHDFDSGPTIYTTRDGVRMTKAGIVRAKFSRRPLGWWKLKRITVEKTRSGKYYCYILYETTVKTPEPVFSAPETTVGLKYSMAHFYVADNGDMADPPHWLKQSQEKLAKIQRRLSRM